MIPEALEKYVYYREADIVLLHGDCREIMAQMEPASIDTIITDPPYGLEFMGKSWDKGVPGPDFWKPALEVCKPGAMLMAFGGTRLYHRMTSAIEDSGWEIRDCLMWLYGTGFPKSHDISKAIDKAKGAERDVVGERNAGRQSGGNNFDDDNYVWPGTVNITAPATSEAEAWDGWGTALKPAWEPIVLAMKPLDGTFAENALKHGVAGLNIDGGRIGTEGDDSNHRKPSVEFNNNANVYSGKRGGRPIENLSDKGRWPANLMLDEDTAPMLDEQSGELTSGANPSSRRSDKFRECYGEFTGESECIQHRGADSGGASRFFYIAKPDKKDRGNREDVDMPLFGIVDKGFRNTHPTVKPTPLMHRLIALQSYLARLTQTPQGGIVLDPFGGSGTTAVAFKIIGRQCIVIEKDSESLDIAIERLKQVVVA